MAATFQTIQTLTLALALLVTGMFGEVVAQDIDNPAVNGSQTSASASDCDVSVHPDHDAYWNLSSSDFQRVCPLQPSFGATPIDVCIVSSARLHSRSLTLSDSCDTRHRIQRVERLLLLI